MKKPPPTPASSPPPRPEVSDGELRRVIADFLAMGHVDNIVAMFRQEPRYFGWTGALLADERYAVRLGMSVLFEQLVALCPEATPTAIPSLTAQLSHESPWVRGEAASILAIIGTPEALGLILPLLRDPHPQVAELARDILDSAGND